MATPKKETKGGNALYWIGGVAATAGVYYFATRYLTERDELMEMRLMQKLQASSSNPESSDSEGD